MNQDQSIKHVPPGFEHELKNIAIDFDGVIHEFLGWGDGTCYGKPLPGSLEAIKKLSQNWNIIIFTFFLTSILKFNSYFYKRLL